MSFVNDLNFDDWDKWGKITKKEININGKKVVHSIFVEIANATQSPFWKNHFENFSRGKIFKYFSFEDNILKYQRGIKFLSLSFAGKTPQELSIKLIGFFQESDGIFSPSDFFHLENRDADELTWKKASSKIKDVLICSFVKELSQVMELDPKVAMFLHNLLRKAKSIGFLNESSVKMNVEERKISRINGLEWDPQNEKFYLDEKMEKNCYEILSKQHKTEKIKTKEISFFYKWSQEQFSQYINIEDNKFKIPKHIRTIKIDSSDEEN